PPPVCSAVRGLGPASTSHYRVVAQNRTGQSTSQDVTFTTLTWPAPAVTVAAASAISRTALTLNAQVDPNHLPTTVHAEYGTTTGYGQVTGDVQLSSPTAVQAFSAQVGGLPPGTTPPHRL